MTSKAIPSRKTARDLVADILRQEILRGVLKPNERLAVPDLALRIGVSQTPTREALQLLESERLVRIDPYKGARVSELDPEDCEELFFMRIQLEPVAARIGAERIGVEGIRRLDTLLRDMTSAAAEGDVNRFIEADWAFHQVQYAAAGRQRLAELIMSLRQESERYTRSSYEVEPGRLKSNLKEHRRCIQLLTRHDGPGAAEWTRSLVTNAASAVQRGLATLDAYEPGDRTA